MSANPVYILNGTSSRYPVPAKVDMVGGEGLQQVIDEIRRVNVNLNAVLLALRDNTEAVNTIKDDTEDIKLSVASLDVNQSKVVEELQSLSDGLDEYFSVAKPVLDELQPKIDTISYFKEFIERIKAKKPVNYREVTANGTLSDQKPWNFDLETQIARTVCSAGDEPVLYRIPGGLTCVPWPPVIGNQQFAGTVGMYRQVIDEHKNEKFYLWRKGDGAVSETSFPDSIYTMLYYQTLAGIFARKSLNKEGNNFFLPSGEMDMRGVNFKVAATASQLT